MTPGRTVAALVGALMHVAFLADAAGASEFKLKLPLGLQESAANIPDDNPLTPEKIALGKQLFWDKRWSKTATVACVSCHLPEHAWSDPRQFSARFDGGPTPRHSPTVINRLFSSDQTYSGGRNSLEDQAIHAVDQSPEMLLKNLGGVAEYQEQFRRVFGTDLTPEGVAKAISAYVRTILSGNSPYDRFQAGERDALSAAAQRGLALFKGKAACQQCHAGFNFTDESYHNLGVGSDKEKPFMGRFAVSKRESDKGAIKTPTLRDVARRSPYMHDGSLKTLEDVVAFYNQGGRANPWLSEAIKPLNLTAAEQGDLIAFLQALTGEVSPEVSSPPRLP
jgi:cytochrome c peroxidase